MSDKMTAEWKKSRPLSREQKKNREGTVEEKVEKYPKRYKKAGPS